MEASCRAACGDGGGDIRGPGARGSPSCLRGGEATDPTVLRGGDRQGGDIPLGGKDMDSREGSCEAGRRDGSLWLPFSVSLSLSWKRKALLLLWHHLKTQFRPSSKKVLLLASFLHPPLPSRHLWTSCHPSCHLLMTQYPWPVSQVTLGNLGSHQLLASPQLDSRTGQLQSLTAAGLHSLPHCVVRLVAVEVKPPPWQLAEQRPFASSAAGNSAAAAAGASTSCTPPVLGALGEPLEGRDQDDSSPRASAHTGGVTGAGGNRGGACWVWRPFAQRGCRAVEGRGTRGEVACRGPVLRAPSSAACMPPEPHPKPPPSYEGSARWTACQSFRLPEAVKALSQLGLPMGD